MFYKNISTAQKTFYGVTFKPGDIKQVPGYINDKGFIRCAPPEPKPSNTKPSSQTKSDKNETKED